LLSAPFFNEFVDLKAINDAYLGLLKSMKIDRWSRLIGFCF
jgi:hypothetical protein